MKKPATPERMTGLLEQGHSTKALPPKSNRAHRQAVVLRGAWRDRALAWPGSAKLLAVHVPTLTPDTLAVIGVGAYFEPLIRGDLAFCACVAPCEPEEENKNLRPLVEFLRHLRQEDA
jgi:hypothetical protein